MIEEIRNPELEVLRLNKESGYKYRERRHDDWTENYTFYRDKVIINRLIQRQSVNLPLMKLACQTNLKDIDDMPVLYFENLDNDKEAEIFKNEYWKITAEQNNFELQDIVDKKQEWLFGRTFDQWQIVDGKVKMTIQDPMDLLVDRYMNPFDLHSSRYLIHTHIFQPLSSLEKNPDYDQEAVKRLIKWHATDQGLIKSKQNIDMLQAKNEKLVQMGVSDVDMPVLGETYIEITLHFVYDKRKDSDEEELFLKVEVDDMEILMRKPLEEVIGVTSDHFFRNHFPYNSWAGDVERQDFWNDGKGDIIRTPNKVLNAWFSQLVENRTLRNLNMNLYDSTLEGFIPQTWQPQAWGWYGIPAGGRPVSEVYQQMQVADLTDSLDEMKFVIEMTEKATGATSTQQGVQTERKITLGEVQLALGEAKERSKAVSKFYTQVWKQRGEMFIKLVEAGADKLDAVKIYKKGKNTSDIFSREISPKDWMTKSGYRCRVWSQDEKNAQDTEALQVLSAVEQNMPGNPKLIEIKQRKLLEYAKLTPDEVNDVMEFEKARNEAMQSMAGGQMMGQPQPQIQLGQPTLPTPAQPVQKEVI